MNKLFITEEIIRSKICVNNNFEFEYRFDFDELIIDIPVGKSFLMYYKFDEIISFFGANQYGTTIRMPLEDVRRVLQ